MTQHETRVRGSRPSHPFHGFGALGWPALLLSLLMVLAACGNDDGGAATEAAAEATVAGTPAAEAEDSGDAASETEDGGDDAAAEAEESGDDAAGGGDITADSDEDGVPDALQDLASETGSATVTIGDQTFEFSLAGTSTNEGTTHIGRCESFFGMVMGNGFAADGRDITVGMEIPPVDWETYEDERFDPPSIEVEDEENNASWVADQGNDFVSGSSVGEYELEGVTASGSATFVNQWATDAEPVEGSFEIDCEA